MAKTRLPNPLERRHLVEGELPPQQATRLAEAYLQEGRTWEAIDFLAKADARERLAELRDAGIAEGDAFLLREISRALGEAASPDQWRALADAAERQGKQRYAAEAGRQAGSAGG